MGGSVLVYLSRVVLWSRAVYLLSVTIQYVSFEKLVSKPRLSWKQNGETPDPSGRDDSSSPLLMVVEVRLRSRWLI